MALPENILSTTSAPSNFLGARSLAITHTIDYEDAGIAIQDPSEGLLYQRWRARLFEPGEATSRVMLDSENTPAFLLLEAPGITEISISFDQNMRPVLAYIQSGVAKLRWFDPVAGEQVITEIGASNITPRVTMDDKRFSATDGYQLNDVILAYVRGGTLYYRQQRDRYLVERSIATGLTTGLVKIGMSRGMRLQFMLEVPS